MKTQIQRMQQFMGIMRNMDPSQMPFGMAVTCQNMAQYTYGRLQRIAGINVQAAAAVDGQYQIPLGMYLKEASGTGTINVPIGVYLGNTNQLTLNQASFESGTTGWTPAIGTETFSQDCTTAQFGTCSGKVVTAATNGSGIRTIIPPGNPNIPVAVGQAYDASAYVKVSTGTQAMQIALNWYTSGGTPISSSTAAFTANTTFTRYSVTGTAPATAAYVNISVTITTATAVTFWVDGAQVELGISASTFALPGTGTIAVPVNLQTPIALNPTGATMVSAASQQFQNFNYVFYAQQHLLASDSNMMMVLNGTSFTPWAPTGSAPTKGGLVRVYLDRLYWAGDQTSASNEGIVYYTDNLTNNFSATGFVNVKELPGPVTAIGVYEPSTGATAGAVGIKGGLLVFKRNGIWYWDESSKDLLSAKIGTRSPHTVKNSPVGTIFLGQRGEQNSIFVIPPGYYGYVHFGEPIDVGKPLFSLLNGYNTATWLNASGQTVTWTGAVWATNNGVNVPVTATAEVDGKFYKLYVSLGTDTQNQTELWLDLDALQQNPGETRGGQPPTAIWYGPHTRGGFDSVFVAETLGTYMLTRGASKANTIGIENINLTSNFTDWNGQVLVAFLDLAMNFAPEDVEKMYDIAELHVAPEANLPNFAITYNFFADNSTQGQGTARFEVDTSVTDPSMIAHVLLPLYGSGRSGSASHHGRLQLTFSLNQRFDLVGLIAQYISPEKTIRITPHVRA